jgi:hypothetical protein
MDATEFVSRPTGDGLKGEGTLSDVHGKIQGYFVAAKSAVSPLVEESKLPSGTCPPHALIFAIY